LRPSAWCGRSYRQVLSIAARRGQRAGHPPAERRHGHDGVGAAGSGPRHARLCERRCISGHAPSAPSAGRGGLHARRARDDCRPFGTCRERAGAWGTTAAASRVRARAVRCTGPDWCGRDALLGSARAPAHHAAVDELSGISLPLALTVVLGRDADVETLRHWLADPAARLITLSLKSK
jgi:hypothetical protein